MSAYREQPREALEAEIERLRAELAARPSVGRRFADGWRFAVEAVRGLLFGPPEGSA